MDEFKKVIRSLESSGKLPSLYKPHRLRGKMSGLWECHIRPDWLLVWQQNEDTLQLVLMSTGTHADLFKR